MSYDEAESIIKQEDDAAFVEAFMKKHNINSSKY